MAPAGLVPIEILLVEDNAGDVRLMQEMLSETGAVPFSLAIANSLAAALARLGAGGIDVLLLDLGLPDSSGVSTFTSVHAQIPTLPIIVLTGFGDPSIALTVVQQGAQDYLVKGQVDGNLIWRTIRYAMERQRGRRELVLSETRVRQLNKSLERRVADRTAELAAANRELETFTYSVSHDLRAPLRQIDGFSRILLEHAGPALDSKSQHYLSRIQEGTQHMGRLVDGLLNLAQLGRQDVHTRATPLEAIVNDALNEVRADWGDRNIQWAIGGLPTVECDPGLMKIVFTNLLSNAIKYTRPREVAIIEVASTGSNGRCTIFVRDNGVGFNMKYADKLFGVFQRLHRADQFEGSGVGLATVQRIIHKHGGEIWAEAESNQGATFSFTLAQEGDSSAAASQQVTTTTSLLGTETILLTEDAPALRGAARQILERYGYTVLEAPNGEKALTLARSRPDPIHLLLTDVVMPGMSGRELAERFTAHRPEVKVLYMSGYTNDAVVRHGVLRPGIAYLQKPFTPESLAHKVREVLDSASLADRR